LAESARACTCVEPRAEFTADEEKYVKYERNKAKAVFSGKVLRIDQIKGAKGKPTGVVRVKFSVDKSYKGAETSIITVSTTNACCICGYPFKVGEEYLVYASGSDSKALRASICSRTKNLRNAAEDLDFLGNAKAISEAKKIKPRSTQKKSKS
jgi:hypothetical protein